MLGLFLIKGGTIQTILTLPLPILTISLWRSSDVLFRPPQQRLSLEAAADLDRRDEVSLCPSFTITSLNELRKNQVHLPENLIEMYKSLPRGEGSVLPKGVLPRALA